MFLPPFITLIPCTENKSIGYWQVQSVEYADPGDGKIYIAVNDEDGNPVTKATCWIYTPSGFIQLTHFTVTLDHRVVTQYRMGAESMFDPTVQTGMYDADMGERSDYISGMGLPRGKPVSYTITFRYVVGEKG